MPQLGGAGAAHGAGGAPPRTSWGAEGAQQEQQQEQEQERALLPVEWAWAQQPSEREGDAAPGSEGSDAGGRYEWGGGWDGLELGPGQGYGAGFEVGRAAGGGGGGGGSGGRIEE